MPRKLRATFFRAALFSALLTLLLPCTALPGKKKSTPPPPPPIRASRQPSATIPITQLGFAAPGEFYLGTRQSIVSLDFLDEDHLLFTFRVPGLYRRDSKGEAVDIERHIKAVVLHIPDGAVQAETLWTVHDRMKYLTMLDNGQFAVRDRDLLEIGDASLQLNRWLHFPGPLYRVEFDPSLEYLVTNSFEPEPTQPKSNPPATSQTGLATANPSTQDAASPDSASPAPDTPDYVLRVLHRIRVDSNPLQPRSALAHPDATQVLLSTRLRSLGHLPMNNQGYLEPLRGHGTQWILNLRYFTGGETRIGAVDSFCTPALDFISPDELLATTCTSSGASSVEAYNLDGHRLWTVTESDTSIWPNLILNRNGSRLARETLQASHPVSATLPLGTEDIVRQHATVYDAATGKPLLHAEPSPIFDAGGNVALSPSGKHAAVLMDGNIQVFDLDEAGNRE